VVGAYDAASIPEIGFGHMGHPWKKHVVRAICAASSLLLCNSEYAAETVRSNVRPRTPIRVLHHGVEFAPPGPMTGRERLVLSVGQIRKVNLARKGHEVFVWAAALVPDARFVLVGEILDGSAEYLRSIAGPNVEIRDHVPQEELDGLYNRAAVYVQASVHESFGLTVVEAMGAGDIPVVSHRGALPEVAGPHALFVDEGDPASVASGIREGLSAGEERRVAAAEYARTTFPLSRRCEGLLDAVASLVRSG
jgi:glycosyltransferase involved in cell wall biosynthesis